MNVLKLTQLWHGEPQTVAINTDAIMELSPGEDAFSHNTTWIALNLGDRIKKIRVMGGVDEIVSCVSGEVRTIQMTGIVREHEDLRVGMFKQKVEKVNAKRHKLQEELLAISCTDRVWKKFTKLESAIIDLVHDVENGL